jgi:hypothetical protein
MLNVRCREATEERCGDYFADLETPPPPDLPTEG